MLRAADMQNKWGFVMIRRLALVFSLVFIMGIGTTLRFLWGNMGNCSG